MSVRIPWDRQETALLIDAYIRVKNKELSQQEAVKEVSSLLRKRAVFMGIEIDDVFRNENGITMQMKIIGGLVEGRPSGLHNASKTFTEMVTLYKTIRSEFNEILIQAKGECVMQVNVQEKFFAWLSARVSSAQLSEFYIVCKDIESFCMNKRILVAPLFETTDFETLQYVTNIIRTNRMFQFKYFRQLGKMKKVMEHYLNFLRENPIPRVAIEADVHKAEPAPVADVVTESSATDVSSETVVQEEVLVETSSVEHTEDLHNNQEIVAEAEVVVEEKDTGAASENEDVVLDETPESENGNSTWNFADERIDFSITNPTEVSYFGEGKECDGWQNAFLQIISFLHEDYPAIIRGMVGYRFAEVGKVILFGRAGIDRFNKAEELNNGLYLETDCTPDEIVTIVHLLMNKCNMDYDNIEITYEQCQDENLAGVEDNSAEPVTDENQDGNTVEVTGYIDDNEEHSNEGVRDYIVQILDEMNISYVDNRNNQGCLWIVGDERLSSVFDNFSQYKAVFHYKADGGRATKGEPAWWTKDIIATAEVPVQDDVEGAVQSNDDEKKNKVVITSVYEGKSAFENWLISGAGLAERSAQSYSSAVNVAGQYSVRLGFSDKHLYFILDSGQVYQIRTKLLANPEFARLNESQHNRYRAALSKYWDYCNALSGGVVVNTPTPASQSKPEEKTAHRPIATVATSTVDPQVKERYTAILAENFVDGFRPAKAIDRNRFRMYYSDMFGQELTEEDEQLVRTLMKVGTLRDERIFVKDETEQKDLLEEINDTIIETFKEGASCIYLDCLFAKFQEQLADMLHIYNVDSLESVLFSSRKRNYFKRYNYLFGYNKEPAPARDVIEYMKNSHLPVTYSEIESGLWYIPLDKIKHTLVTTPGIVNVASEAYLYAPNLPVSEREIQQIAELISHALLQRSYISDVELMHLIEEHCPSVLMNTPDYPMWGLRNALAYLLRDNFSFRGAIISDKNEEISMAEVFSDFCQRSEHITVDELRNFASELNTVIYWDSVYGEMVRINQNEFIRRDQIHFDIEQTDSVLDSLIQSAYTPIKTINLFLHLPAIDVPWNNFVLESYVANYSKKFRLLHASYTATDCCGAMVRQESGITDYRTLIVDVLAKNTGWKNKKDALQLLVDLGYQQRRSYSDIEKVMQEAKARMSIPKK